MMVFSKRRSLKYSLSSIYLSIYLSIYSDKRQRIPALCQVRVPAPEVVHARHRLHLLQVEQVRDQGNVSIYTSIFLSIYLPSSHVLQVKLNGVKVPIHPYINLSIYLSSYVFSINLIYLPIYLSTYKSRWPIDLSN